MTSKKVTIEALKPYLNYGDALEASEPVIAMACRMYYATKFMEIKKSLGEKLTADESALIAKLLKKGEEARDELGLSKEERQTMIEQYVVKIFVTLDKDERTAPKVTKDHARQFRSAGHFIDLLTIYGELSPDWQAKKTYCAYKAGNILRCLKQGIEPPRGHPNDPPPSEKKEDKKMDSKVPPVSYPPPPSSIKVSPPSSYAPSAYQNPTPTPSVPPGSGLPGPSLMYPGFLAPDPSISTPPLITPGGIQVTKTASYSGVASTTRRKLDRNNPYNELGQIMRGHPKYFEAMGQAKKNIESAISQIASKTIPKARECLEKAYGILHQLEP